jgi:UDPglucose 6-dehydrogenase
MVKLTANAFLATKISFANEIANVCETTGADVTKVMAAVGADHRLGTHFLSAGIGWGGSCFPKDATALKAMASNGGYHPQILTDVIEVNNHQRSRAVTRLKEELGTLSGQTIAVPHMRDSAAVPLNDTLGFRR